MKFFKKIANDIAQRKNIESYLVIFLAIGIAVIDIFDLGQASWMNEVTLAILALLAYGRIEDRRYLDDLLVNKITLDDILLEKYPPSFHKDITQANELWITGIYLSNTIGTNLKLLEGLIKRGTKLRILMVTPGSVSSQIAANRIYRPMTPERLNERINETIDYIKTLQTINSANLEFHTLDTVPAYGFFAINPNSKNAVLYAENFRYKNPDKEGPIFRLVPTDGHWYESFSHEVNQMWNFSEEYKL